VSPLLSVIIPTHNRGSLLLRAVEALLIQAGDIDDQVEIIVVDDGSTEPLREPLADLASQYGLSDQVRYFYQAQRGPAAARNRGIVEATGEIVLFLGDDIIAAPGLLRTHMVTHLEEHPEPHIAVLGMADLSREFVQTPFVRWWRRWNFRYDLLIEGKREPDFSFFYTNNLSLKSGFMLEHGLFDESFRYAAYEDGELGYRLSRKGMQLVFKPEAAGDHHHRIDLHVACKRMITRGRGYDLFIEKTGMLGLSQIWLAMGSGPWMIPAIVRPLFRLSEWLETRLAVGPVFIPVLMYFFQVGRGKRSPIPELI
jgi:glycosyltransferase involved in cell wall biosynthesis